MIDDDKGSANAGESHWGPQSFFLICCETKHYYLNCDPRFCVFLDYQFNGKPEKIQSQFSRLSTIADKAGNFTIVSVGDQRNKCRSYPRDLTKIIYELPSTRVSAGKDTLENIREGKGNIGSEEGAPAGFWTYICI